MPRRNYMSPLPSKERGQGEACLLTDERSLTLFLSLHQGRGGISCAGRVGRFANALRLWM